MEMALLGLRQVRSLIRRGPAQVSRRAASPAWPILAVGRPLSSLGPALLTVGQDDGTRWEKGQDLPFRALICTTHRQGAWTMQASPM